ncbi:MAG: hypothetical protein J0M04_16320 [Verrucomicrobia bacterium]|nr:hypothetical protein [Verrucomicrobiota bacterium]
MNRDDYSQRQKAKDAEYERQYREWVASLPPEERRKLGSNGLDRPDTARHGSGSAKGDAADSPLMRVGDDPALVPDPEPERKPAPPPDAEQTWDALRRMLGEIISRDNARLTAECFAIAAGLTFSGGDSMMDVARRHGVTRAAVSKRCVELTELLGLRPSRAMRSLTARQAYRAARISTTRSHEPTDPS